MILRALLNGHIVKQGENEYLLDDEYYLCMYMYTLSGERKLAKVSFGAVELPQFIKWTHTFTEAEVTLIAANLALTAINTNRRT